MEFNYRYHGNTAVESTPGSTAMSFAPDTFRQPTYFRGRLSRKVPFREAISALHDVVVSDLRFQPRDTSAYKEWAAQQELAELAELTSAERERDLTERFNKARAELQELRSTQYKLLAPFYRAQHKYFKYLYKHDKDAWWVLDPVITVHPDQVFFECFSRDESSYGRLGCSYEVFEELGERACGTTNVDYSESLYNEFQKIRDYKSTELTVDPSGFEVEVEAEESYKEVKIDLPESWVRGFLQVSSAMTLPGRRVELQPMDVHNLCFVLRRRKERHGPRSLRFLLRPGEPVRVICEPWNLELTCPRSPYRGEEADEIRIWGRRRFFLLERLIPVARSFTLHLLGSGLPSFVVADLGDMSFTLGLSGWTANDWSRAGNFDLMAPRTEVDELTRRRVFEGLRETWYESPDDLAARLNLERRLVLGALGAYTQAGRAIFDLEHGVYRVRELSREPLPMEQLRFSNPREEAARRLADAVKPSAEAGADGRLSLKGKVKDGSRTHDCSLVLDRDERLVEGHCACSFFFRNKLYKGPCEHLLALRMAHNERNKRWLF